MKIGVPFFRLRFEQMAAVARRAEDLGFESVWLPEHLVLPTRFTSRYPYSSDGIPPIRPDAPHLDPLILLTHVAAATSRIRLGTNIYLLPLRHPLATARAVMSLDVLSAGRVTLGVGVGWLEEEFRAAGIEFRTRGASSISARSSSSRSRYRSLTRRSSSGGESEAALRRAADLGDGWYGVGHSPASAARQAVRLRALLAQRRPGAPFELTVSHGGASLGQGDVDRYAEAGIDRVVVLPWRRGREAEAELGRLAEAVLR